MLSIFSKLVHDLTDEEVLAVESDLLRVNDGEASEGLVAEALDFLAEEDTVGDL